jgi:hypothetical protein
MASSSHGLWNIPLAGGLLMAAALVPDTLLSEPFRKELFVEHLSGPG